MYAVKAMGIIIFRQIPFIAKENRRRRGLWTIRDLKGRRPIAGDFAASILTTGVNGNTRT